MARTLDRFLFIDGRTTRKRWWLVFMVCCVVPWLIVVALAALAGETTFSPGAWSDEFVDLILLPFKVLFWIMGFVAIVLHWFALMAGAQRLQDMALPGQWAFVLFAGIFALWLVIPAAAIAALLIAAVWLGSAPGTRGANDYGPDPRGSRTTRQKRSLDRTTSIEHSVDTDTVET